MIETAPAQRVRELAGAIGCEHHARDRGRLNGAKLRNADLKVRKQLQQECLELLVRPIDFVDQEHGGRCAADRSK